MNFISAVSLPVSVFASAGRLCTVSFACAVLSYGRMAGLVVCGHSVPPSRTAATGPMHGPARLTCRRRCTRRSVLAPTMGGYVTGCGQVCNLGSCHGSCTLSSIQERSPRGGGGGLGGRYISSCSCRSANYPSECERTTLIKSALELIEIIHSFHTTHGRTQHVHGKYRTTLKAEVMCDADARPRSPQTHRRFRVSTSRSNGQLLSTPGPSTRSTTLTILACGGHSTHTAPLYCVVLF